MTKLFFESVELGVRGWTEDLQLRLLRGPDLCNFKSKIEPTYFRSSRVFNAERTHAFKRRNPLIALIDVKTQEAEANDLRMQKVEFECIMNGELNLACYGKVSLTDRLFQEAQFFFINIMHSAGLQAIGDSNRSFVYVHYLRLLFSYRIFTLRMAGKFPDNFDLDDYVNRLIASQYPELIPCLEENFVRIQALEPKPKRVDAKWAAHLVRLQAQRLDFPDGRIKPSERAATARISSGHNYISGIDAKVIE